MKAFNGQLKMANGGHGHSFLTTVRNGYKKLVSSKSGGSQHEEQTGTITIMDVARGVVVLFAVIGIIATVRWIAPTNAWGSPKKAKLPANTFELTKECLEADCPWNQVMTELANRLSILETAFQQQMSARQTGQKGEINASELNAFLNGKLDNYSKSLENLTQQYLLMERRVARLTSKLRLDEILGFLFFIMLMIELVSKAHPHVLRFIEARKLAQEKPPEVQPEKKVESVKQIVQSIKKNGSMELKKNGDVKKHTIRQNSSSAHPSPKHAVLRNEMCVLLFRRENNNVYTSLMEAMLKHFNDVKLASNPFFIVDALSDIKQVPPVKLYVVICDCEVSSGKTNGWDLYIAVIKVLKSLTAHVVVIITNDEGSKKLINHSMYNSNLRLINSFEIMQDLAANGRLFTMWRDMGPHQMSHVRKIVRTVLNVRPSMNIR